VPTLNIKNFPKDNQPWRIEWIGQIFYMPGKQEGKIRIHISRLKSDAPKDKALHNSSLAGYEKRTYDRRHYDLKIGIIQHLKIGSVWINGQCQLDYRADAETIEISDPSALNLLSLDQAGCDKEKNPVVHNYQYLIANEARDESSVVIMDTHPSYKQIVIPSSVIFQSCYVTSPKAASKIIFGKLNELIDLEDSGFIDGKKNVFRVNLHKDYKDIEGVMLANLAADKAAKRNVNSLHQRFVVASSLVHASKYSIEIGFPFSAFTKLKVLGKRIAYTTDRGKNEYGFLVTEIVAVETKFPFDTIVPWRKNKNGSAPLADDVQPFGRTSEPNKNSDEAEEVYFTDRDPTNKLEDTEIPLLSIVDTSHIEIIEKEKEIQNYARMSFKRIKADDVIGDGVSTGDITSTSEGASQLNNTLVVAKLDAIFEVLKHLRNHNIEVLELEINDARRSDKGIVNFFPRTVKGCRTWHLKENKYSPRAYVIARLYSTGKYYYLIDIESKGERSLSIAILSTPYYQEVPIKAFREIMLKISKANGLSLFDDASYYAKQYLYKGIDHCHKGNPTQVANNILKHIRQ
jgi:hypothetical protein